MRSFDWSASPLGPVEEWPQSLKTAVRIMLTSRHPMFVWWGEQLINLYNDAYKATLGRKHPDALGQPAAYVWWEIWPQVGPLAELAMLKNEGTFEEATLFIMERNGYPEETYYTFSYSPVPNDQGGSGGIICANTDDTGRSIGERQLALLKELAARTADARTFDEACTLSASCLETNPYDLPFALIYLVDPDQQRVSLAGTSGIERGHAAAPESVALDSPSVWGFAEVMQTHTAHLISDLGASFDNLPMGAWQRPPQQAVAVPIAPSGQTGKAGIMVAGLNPFRLLDENYRRFLNLVSAQVAASIANAQAYEEERKRADVSRPSALAEPMPPTTGDAQQTTGHARILMADDNADIRQYVQRLLADRYSVTAVADGIAALAAARREPPDVIVADVMMPHLDGFGLLRAVRDDARLAGVPVILLSARAGEESREEGLGAAPSSRHRARSRSISAR